MVVYWLLVWVVSLGLLVGGWYGRGRWFLGGCWTLKGGYCPVGSRLMGRLGFVIWCSLLGGEPVVGVACPVCVCEGVVGVRVVWECVDVLVLGELGDVVGAHWEVRR